MPRFAIAEKGLDTGRRLLMGLLLLNALACFWVAVDLVDNRQNHEHQAQVVSRSMAQALDLNVTGSAERINLLLLSCTDFLEDRLASRQAMSVKEASAFFHRQQMRVPELAGLRATDANGVVVFGSGLTPGQTVSWADRDFFIALKAKPDAGMFVSDPLVGKLSKRWVVPFSRRYNDADGKFAGVVSATIYVTYLEQVLSAIDVGPAGTAVLRDSKLDLITRYPHVEGPAGQTGYKAISTELAQAIASGEKVVTYHAVQTSDGVERINTYRRLTNLPFHLVTGTGAPDYLRDFKRELAVGISQLLAFLLISSGGAWLIWRSIQHTARESERSSALLRGASDGVHVLDAAGNLVEASDSFFDMLGYPRDEGMTLNVRDWDAHFPHAQLGDILQSLLREGRANVVTRHRRKDGFEFPVEVSVLPITMQGKKLLFASSRDITDRQQAVLELQQSHESLERRVEERTQELALALQSAELANRSRGEFLANTSHEIRTPMNSVLGMVYLALKHNSDPRQHEYLQRIQRAGVHLMRIIDDILDFSKIDAGKLQLEIAGFDLGLAMEHLLHLAEGRAQEKGLDLQLEKEAAVPQLIQGDALRIEQILLNFVNNAIKFTEQGRIAIRVRCLERTQAHCQLSFEVADSGCGLQAGEVARLFQSFEQGDKSTTRQFGGTGLGLAICRQLAHLMAGEVGVESAPGQGSTFWFRAQFAIAEAVPLAPDHSGDVQQAMHLLRGTRMLVVDDNEFNLDVARGVLEDAGVAVHTAANGAQALALLQTAHFDCVLMDVQMPVMDGYAATRQIRADARLRPALVIAMTANASGSDHSLCLQAGMDDVIRKPIEPAKMFLTLARSLQARRQGTEAEPLNGPIGAADDPYAELNARLESVVPWDKQALARIVGDNAQAQQRLLHKFQSTAAQTVLEMAAAVQAQDWPAAAGLGHKLKSSARSVGAMQLGLLSDALEQAGRAHQERECRHLAGRVQQAFAAVQAQLHEKH